MMRMHAFLAGRMMSRIAVAVIIVFGILALSESLDTWRFSQLLETRGIDVALLAIVVSAARWSVKALPVTVLIGAIFALVDLQQHRELMAFKTAGVSIWRILVGPVLAVAAFSIFVALVADDAMTRLGREVIPAAPTNGEPFGTQREVWLQQRSGDLRYIVHAENARPGGLTLDGVTVFVISDTAGTRLSAPIAEYRTGSWVLTNATRAISTRPHETFPSFVLPTDSPVTDLGLKLSTSEDYTYLELMSALADGIDDPVVRTTAAMRVAKLTALPLLLTGSLLIAFAFTAGYRRTNPYGATIVYGILLGFVVFVITEMADRAGASGVLDPLFAGWGPGFVAIVIGVTVLLYKEDGRA